MKNSIVAAVVAASLGFATAAQAEITVGFITSQSGPGSSIGVLYDRGMKAAVEYASSIGAEKIKLIQLDDGSDPSAATRNARKLVEENKVDLLIGTSTAASTSAMVPIANELKVPMIAISPISVAANDAGDRWAIVMPQPPTLMVKVVVDRMKRDGVKQFAYIGFSDAWGDLVYNGAQKPAEADGLKILTNERYARTDTSVTGQVLKMMATKPDAVLLGGAATQGALPPLALAERGYKGAAVRHAGAAQHRLHPRRRQVGRRRAGLGRSGDRGRAAARFALQQEDLDGLPRRLPEGQRRADHGRLLGLLLRRLAGVPRRRQARDGHGRQARHAGVPRGAARTRSSAPRTSWARTPSTTSSPATATASTSARW